jgi:hypothetical protein
MASRPGSKPDPDVLIPEWALELYMNGILCPCDECTAKRAAAGGDGEASEAN